ncbi:MAG: PfkB family carbohydrate kinase [Myxococcota bacterium]
MRVAVIGHVEWVSFHRIDQPLQPGAIVRGRSLAEEAAGGGAVAAVELARLTGACTLFTALGRDAIGQAIPGVLAAHGVEVQAEWRDEAHRTASTYLDPDGERTIVVHGPAQAPSPHAIDMSPFDAVYLCKGDAAVVRRARAARVVCATARILPSLQAAGVTIDVLVHSANDPSEAFRRGDLDPEPTLVATTEGAAGGRYITRDGQSGRWAAAELEAPILDTYGAGDSFAAALTFAIARGDPPPEALAFAAGRGAAALRRRGAYGAA